MRVIAVTVGLVLSTFIFVANGSTAQAQQAEQPKAKQKKVMVTVKQGDSLSKIAKRKSTTYKRMFYANKQVSDPDLIYPGQKLRVPGKKEKLQERPMGAVVSTPAPAQPVAQTPVNTYQTVPAPQPEPTPAPKVSASSAGVWDQLAACESGGNWAINTGNGYYGGLQFSLSSWQGVGGTGYPHQASKAEQIRRAEMLKGSGGWGHWPACSAKLGLL